MLPAPRFTSNRDTMKLLLINFFGPELFLTLFFIGVIVPVLLYINTIHKTLDEIRDEYRLIPSRSPMLLLVPILGSLMLFLVVIKLSQSLDLEFEERGIAADGKGFGQTVGLIMSASFLLVVLAVAMGLLGISLVLFPLIRIVGIVGLICWIIHWSKVATYRKMLLANSVKGKAS